MMTFYTNDKNIDVLYLNEYMTCFWQSDAHCPENHPRSFMCMIMGLFILQKPKSNLKALWLNLCRM